MRIGFAFDIKTEGAVDTGPTDDWQDEFDSPETVAAIAGALRELGHQVVDLGDGRELIETLLREPPELVFNIAEGHGVGRCREARVPAVCEMLGVPYVGSDPLTLAATLDKDIGRRLVASHGVPIPAGALIDAGSALPSIPFPAIVKPAWEGSSKGVSASSIVRAPAELAAVVADQQRRYRQPVLVEEFIEGEEITVGLIGSTHRPEVLGVMRILPRQPAPGPFIYDHAVKSDCLKHLIYETPARIPAAVTAEIERWAARAYQALGCRDFARIDFRVRDGVPYFLEANPLPGLSPTVGDIVLLAKGYGIGHTELISRIVQAARDRLRL